MLKRKKGILVILGLLVALALLLACAAGEEEATPAPGETPGAEPTATKVVLPTATPTPVGGVEKTQGGILRAGSIAYQPPNWDPYRSTSYKTQYPNNMVHAFLINFHYGADYPSWNFDLTSDGLAESWEISADGKTYTFHLKKGVKFQDRPPVNGRELVATDVKYSLEAIRDTVGSQQAWKFEAITSIETPDKYTVVVHLKNPAASFMLYLGDPYSEIVAPETEWLEGDRKQWYTAVGAGPFQVVNYVPDVGIYFQRNPNYYRANEGLPYLDEVRWLLIADSSTTLAGFRAGEIDIRGISRTDLESVMSTNPDLHCYEGEISSATLGITFRTDKAPYDDVRVRRAISMALDRQAIIDAQYLGYGENQKGPINLSHPYYLENQGECDKYNVYNPEEAKKLLAEAGYAGGWKDTLESTPGYGTTVVEYGEIIIDMMAKVGIELEYKLKDYPAWVASGLQGKYEGMFWGYFYGSSIDPDDWLVAPFLPFDPEKGGKNQAHVDDPEVLDMIYAQAQALSEDERKETLADIQSYLACQQYYIFWPRAYGITCEQPWVYGYRTHAGFYATGRQDEVIWMTEDAPNRQLALTKDNFPYAKFEGWTYEKLKENWEKLQAK